MIDIVFEVPSDRALFSPHDQIFLARVDYVYDTVDEKLKGH